MTLEQLPAVKIDSRDGYKYIACIVSDGCNQKLVIRATETADYHREILANLRREAKNFYVKCIGGGRINVNPESKTIKIWGYSGDFGREPNRQQTAALLKTAYPDFEIIIGEGG